MQKRYIFGLLAAMLAGLSLSGCGDKANLLQSVEPTTSNARIKFVHAASDASGVNFFVNSKIVSATSITGAPVTYFSAFPATDYLSFKTNNDTIALGIRVETASPTATVTSTKIAAIRSDYYTVAVIGTSPNYETLVLKDDIPSGYVDNLIRIRFINLIPNSPELDLVATPTGGSAITFYQKVGYKLGSVGFSTFSPVTYLTGVNADLNPLTYTSVQFTMQIKNSSTGAVLATLATAGSTFVRNKVYTLIARGQIGGTGTKAVTLDRIVHK
jgi:hypothetical protein